jgi:hypothetical protein
MQVSSSETQIKHTTYGQDMIDTSAMPTIMALFTLKVMRYAVTIPPQKMPIHIWGSSG